MSTRKRTIQPNIWQDTDFGNLTPLAQLVFLGCITQADDEGRLIGHPAVIKSTLFPYGQVKLEDVFKALEEIAENMPNFLYYQDGTEYFIQLKNWHKHQVLRSDRMQKSTYPHPPKELMAGRRQADDGQAGAKVSKEVSKEVSKDDQLKTISKLNQLRKELSDKGII